MTASPERKGGTGKRTQSGSNNSRTTNKRNTSNTEKRSSTTTKSQKAKDISVYNEVFLILIFAVVIFLFLCTIGVIGAKDGANPNFGDFIQEVMLGMFGIMAYVVPLITFFAIAFGISNKNSHIAVVKIISLIILVIIVGMIFEMIGFRNLEEYVGSKEWSKALYTFSKDSKVGGGWLFGSITLLFYSVVGKIGTFFCILVLGIISLVLLTEKSFFNGLKKGSRKLYNTTAEGGEKIKELNRRYKEGEEEKRREEELQKEQVEEEKLLRADKKAAGVSTNTLLKPHEDKKENDKVTTSNRVQNEVNNDNEQKLVTKPMLKQPEKNDIHLIEVDTDVHDIVIEEHEQNPQTASWYKSDAFTEPEEIIVSPQVEQQKELIPEVKNNTVRERPVAILPSEKSRITQSSDYDISKKPDIKPVNSSPKVENVNKGEYSFPPLSLLGKSEQSKSSGDGKMLQETATRLEQTLETFGVKVKVTDYSQGPAVTRYELHPEQGVKVSKIVGLANDIKLNLAAPDIRIEAPIPGKMAVGIEVPNKKSNAVPLRDLLELSDFKGFQSNLAFAVGKDIGGQPVITDIAKMPHLLIAGATGSGKSVCINTLIMSILYKSKPDDVKLIMIDPKVVELSVYNGIPHLMIPVVTDTKLANQALQWGVTEMTERYKKFADLGVRDLKGYNQKADEMAKVNQPDKVSKLPQIVIIVDELADLMMVASKEVEESICRLAQLARAAGIHLIIATQRPSAEVITGLIKTNMPSRIAFSVSSGIDSRIILDENGAEKLIGKGDMLFFPQGYTKPSRVQGAFVSDQEVANVVDYIKNHSTGTGYDVGVEEKLQKAEQSSFVSGTGVGDGRDEYFADAGRFMIEKQKGSIGMLQRFFRIGFNRAARIMDQLEEANVVSAEEGTKPRRILMNAEEFEQYLNNNND